MGACSAPTTAPAQGDDGGDPAREGAVIAGEGRVIGKMTSRVDHEEEQDQKDGEDRPSGLQAPAWCSSPADACQPAVPAS